MNRKIIKVAYICHFSSPELHARLPLRLRFTDILTLALKKKPICTNVNQFAVWNSNAIEEMKSHTKEVEFHVIAPYPYLKGQCAVWTDEGITYHIFRDHSFFSSFVQRNLFKNIQLKHKRNRYAIKKIVQSISPDIIHVVGADNPYYSLCALDVPSGIPLIVQLQTLLSEPGFEEKYTISHEQYVYRSIIETHVLKRADYVGAIDKHFMDVIKDKIKADAHFLDITLAVAEKIKDNDEIRTNDFVYFSKDISKAADWAIEAFALAYKKHPEIKLKIIGNYTPAIKKQLDSRVEELDIQKAVVFTGMLPSHRDVINEVRKSKYALLPIKADYISGTIREAMASGVPVITTVTPGTPTLNRDRESVLISNAQDFQSMSDNMCRLIENEQLYSELKRNAIITVSERFNNHDAINHWVESYQKICHKAQ